MSIIDNIKNAAARLVGGRELKRAFDVIPMGIAGRPVRSPLDLQKNIDAYRTSELVFACINIKAQAAVDPRLIVERKNLKTGTWEEVEGHPMRRLMMRPNPMMGEAEFAQAVITSKDICGVFYAEIVRKGVLPIALYPLDPSKMKPIPDSNGGVSAYEWRSGNMIVTIPAEDVLVWRNYDPQNRYHGQSPLSVAMGSVDADNLQTDYIQAFFATGGVPSGILTIKGRTVNQEESDIIRAKWRQKFNPRYGGVKDDIAVLDENAEYQVLGSRLDQLQNEEIRSVAEARICMVFNVPPLIVYAYVGLLHATYSNLKEAWAQFWASNLSPWFKQYRGWLTWALLSQFESIESIYGETVRLMHDLSEVTALREDVNATQDRARNNLLAGGILLNEFRDLIGLEPDPKGDVYLRSPSFALVPWNYVAPPPLAPVSAPAKAVEHSAESKAVIPSAEWFTKALNDRDRIAERNKNKIERYVFGEYHKAVEAVKSFGEKQAMPIDDKYLEAVEAVKTFKEKMPLGTEMFDEYLKAIQVVNSYGKAARSLEDYILSVLDDGTELDAIVRPMFKAALKSGFGDGTDLLSISMAFDLENVNVQRVLKDLLKKIKRDVPNTTIEAIRELVGKQAQEGWSIPQLADEILASGQINSPVRAQMIAHTETAAAYTKGSIVAYKESGVVKEVEWNSFLDERTSEICRELNGKRVKLGELFKGEFDGPPAHPNCRSAVLPIVN